MEKLLEETVKFCRLINCPDLREHPTMEPFCLRPLMGFYSLCKIEEVGQVLTLEKESEGKEGIPVFDLDKMSWERIKQAAGESKWMPKEYMMNDWVADVCRFLNEGEQS